jgi:hypothetical protein
VDKPENARPAWEIRPPSGWMTPWKTAVSLGIPGDDVSKPAGETPGKALRCPPSYPQLLRVVHEKGRLVHNGYVDLRIGESAESYPPRRAGWLGPSAAPESAGKWLLKAGDDDSGTLCRFGTTSRIVPFDCPLCKTTTDSYLIRGGGPPFASGFGRMLQSAQRSEARRPGRRGRRSSR